MSQKETDAQRLARRREWELSHYITKREALALVMNVMARHERDRHGPAVSWWRKLWKRGAE